MKVNINVEPYPGRHNEEFIAWFVGPDFETRNALGPTPQEALMLLCRQYGPTLNMMWPKPKPALGNVRILKIED